MIAYREIRSLELAALRAQYGDQQIDAALLARVTVDQFYGIEFEEFPARIAEVAMWMMDHIANNAINEAFRLNYARIPLKDSAHILHGDALEADWAALLPPGKCSYIMGNPPFIGQSFQSRFQREQMGRVVAAPGGKGGSLDYVAAWFIKAAQYAQANQRIRIAFVSTNSICQGEQVAQLWPLLFDRYGMEIAFAHRTFSWGSEARGKAHVHVVIVGLAHRDYEPDEKRLFSYPHIKGDPVESRHSALTPYLFDAKGVANKHLVVREHSTPLSNVPVIVYGNKPVDNGKLIFGSEEKAKILESEPDAAQYIRQLVSSQEFLNGGERWCLWLADIEPSSLRAMPEIMRRVEAVNAFRLASAKIPTQKAAQYSYLFAELRQPKSDYILVPRHSSENRPYVPFGFFPRDVIVHDSCTCIPNGQLFHFGTMSTRMHMAWLSHVGGRLKSDFRYANTLVYNTFPWPDTTPAQRAKIEALAQAVLDARAAYPTSSLADLYDPDTMPPPLRKAHTALDLAVDRLYRAAPFASDRDRVEHLFGRYEALVNPLGHEAVKQNRRVNRKRGSLGA